MTHDFCMLPRMVGMSIVFCNDSVMLNRVQPTCVASA